MLQFSLSTTGQEAELSCSASFEISLPETPGTGFQWQMIENGEPVCKVTHEDFQPSVGVGGQGSRHWQFQAVRVGAAEIRMALRRSWERSAAPAQSFTLRLVVKA